MRGNFISDSAFFLYIFMAVFYIKGWLDYKYQGVSKKFINKDTVYIIYCMFYFSGIIDS